MDQTDVRIKEILQFIRFRFWADEPSRKIPAIEHLFAHGACYYFAVILKDRFPELEIWYDEIEGHFETSLPNSTFAFDIHGVHERSAASVRWTEMNEIDPAHAKRILRDCIL